MATLSQKEAATHTACTLLADLLCSQPIACMQCGSQPHCDQGLPWCFMFLFLAKDSNVDNLEFESPPVKAKKRKVLQKYRAEYAIKYPV